MTATLENVESTTPPIMACPPIPAPDISIEVVTPERATEWLGHNTLNRNVKRAVVALYARDLLDGRWRFTGESVKFSKSGRLLDGQHRLLALVQANVSAYILVVRGLEEDAQDVMDSGAKRTAANALQLHGEKNSGLLASAVSMVITDGAAHRRSVSNAEVVAAVSVDDTIRTVACEIIPRFKFDDILTDTVAFYAYWRLMRIDPGATMQFFDQLSSMTGLSEGSPVLALHHRLRRVVTTQGKASWRYRREALACIFTAWNAWIRDEPRNKIQISMIDGRVIVPEPKGRLETTVRKAS